LRFEHGLLPTDQTTGEISYAFIHGNWSLDNSRKDSRWCGVNNEITILQETGCYADFTMPSAPSSCQTKIKNSIYYAIDDPVKPKSHDTGSVSRVLMSQEGLLMVQGVLDARISKSRVKIENSEITFNNYVTVQRMNSWLNCGIAVAGRPDWHFIKLHAHGTQDKTMLRLFEKGNLGELFAGMEKKCSERGAQLHYVSARQMVNVIHALESGVDKWSPDLLDFRYRLED